MLKVIADQRAIKKYAGQFNRKFKPFADEQIKVKLGHQGASFSAKIFWSKKTGHLGNFLKPSKKCVTGTLSASGSREHPVFFPIASEINFPWHR